MVGSGAGSSRMSKPKPEPAQRIPQHSAELHIDTQRARGTTCMMKIETPEAQEQKEKERNREGGRRRES